MSAVDELNRQFSVEGALRFEEGPGGLTRLWVDTAEAQAEIYLQGAHVALWRPATAVHPVLFMSEKRWCFPGSAIAVMGCRVRRTGLRARCRGRWSQPNAVPMEWA
jgi:hypothetical protein